MDTLYESISPFLAFVQEKINHTYINNLPALGASIVISIGMLLLVMLIEAYYTGWQESSLRRVLVYPSKSTLVDTGFFFLHIFAAVPFLAVAGTLGIPMMIKSLIYNNFQLNMGGFFPPFVHLMLYLFVLDFFSYWQHRLMHRFPTLWEIHSFHHSATNFNVVTVFREHPLDKAIGRFASLIPAMLIGVPTAEYPIFITVYGIIGYFKHSRIPWNLGWFGKYVVQSPQDHWIHHSNQREHYDTNFANVFAIWDHVFGSYYKGDSYNAEIGLDDSPYNQGVLKDMWLVQIRFMKSLARNIQEMFRGWRPAQQKS